MARSHPAFAAAQLLLAPVLCIFLATRAHALAPFSIADARTAAVLSSAAFCDVSGWTCGPCETLPSFKLLEVITGVAKVPIATTFYAYVGALNNTPWVAFRGTNMFSIPVRDPPRRS
jgi:hypothetical protein